MKFRLNILVLTSVLKFYDCSLENHGITKIVPMLFLGYFFLIVYIKYTNYSNPRAVASIFF